eukprot:gene10642-10713_t
MSTHVLQPSQTEFDQCLAHWSAQYPKLETLVREGAPHVRIVRFLGLSLWQDGRLEEAAVQLHQTAVLAPQDPVILAELGSLLCSLNRRADAHYYLKSSLKIDPGQPQVWLTFAMLNNDMGEKLVAEQAYRSALELAPDHAEGLSGLGLLYVELRRYEDAAGILSAAVARGVATLSIHACLAQTLYLLGDFSASCRAFEKVIQAFPDVARIVQKYAQARLIEAFLQGGATEAITAYRQAAGAHALDTVAVCRTAFQALIGFEKKDAAIRVAQFLLAQNPGDPVILYHLDALTGLEPARAPDDYLKASFDSFAANFDTQLVEVLNYHIPEKCHSQLSGLGLHFSNAIDLGCGTGLAAPYLAQLCGALTGVDISNGMLDKARERQIYTHIVEDEVVHFLDAVETNFDLVVSLDVLVYFGDLSALFAVVADKLMAGGIFCFSFEIGRHEPYQLRSSGRFAHTPSYIEHISSESFDCIDSVDTPLRLEANRPVAGKLVTLRRKARS